MEPFLKLAGNGKLEVVSGFLLPDPERFSTAVNFEEHRADRFAGVDFEVAVRDDLDGLGNRLAKSWAIAFKVTKRTPGWPIMWW